MENSDLVTIIRTRARSKPNSLAFGLLSGDISQAVALDYARLDATANAIATLLHETTAYGDRILLLYPQGLDFIPAFLACLYTGRIAVTGYPPQSPKIASRVRAILADAQASCVLTVQDQLETVSTLLAATGHDAKLRVHASDVLPLVPCPDPTWKSHPLAFLQYTSGSTGSPKGVRVSHGNILANLRDLDASLVHDEHSCMVSWLPVFHDMGLIYGVLMPLFKGFPCYLMSPTFFLQRPLRWLEAISHYRATHSAAPNFAYDLCVDRSTPEQIEQLKLSRWRVALNGAEPVRAQTLARFSEAFAGAGFKASSFFPGYGMAEATLKISCPTANLAPVLARLDSDALKSGQVLAADLRSRVTTLVGCGAAAETANLIIVDPASLETLAPDRVGEIWFASDSVADGYWGKPELSAQIFAATTAEHKGPFLRTGDLGFVLDGSLFVCGRCKDLVIVRGSNYFPSDLEQAMQADQPGLIAEAGVAFSVEIEATEELILVQEVAYGHEAQANLELLLDHVFQTIAETFGLRPLEVVLVRRRSLEKTTSGKLKRSACRELWQAGGLKVLARRRLEPEPRAEQAAQTVETQSDLGLWLRQLLAARLQLNLDQLDPDAAFGRFGLDSALAAELSARLSDRIGRELTPDIFYNFPSIRLLHSHLAGLSAPSPKAKHVPEPDTVAVIGLACRFPGAVDANAFWQLLESGGDAVAQAPPGRRSSLGIQAGYLEGVDLFDADFFGISQQEAAGMDPQQRILLETVWDAIADSGATPEQFQGSACGVFVGISSFDHARLSLTNPDSLDVFSGTGNALSIAANRISWLLDLSGPSWAVDSACSSSLLAVHQACHSLKTGECSQAIVAGVNLLLTTDLTQSFKLAGLLSSDQRCKTFDAAADGYVRGEGCGVVLLKLESVARAAGDQVLARIRGTAVNQDGRSSSLTAPRGPAQRQVLKSALDQAGWVGGQLTYLEAHGSGTALGDTIELNTLKEVLMEKRQQLPCWIGSVKTNIGHLEAAAGIAGLIKLVLMLEHQRIPANLHFKRLNPMIQLADTPLQIPSASQDWPETDEPRRAGVSAFGFGGTNVHLLLEQAQPALLRSPHGTCSWTRRSFPLPKPLELSPRTQSEHPLLGARQSLPAALVGHCLWQADLDTANTLMLQTHQLWGSAVMPITAIVEMAMAAAALALGPGPHLIEHLEMHEPLFLSQEPRRVQTMLVVEDQGHARFSIHGRAYESRSDQPWSLHAQARIQRPRGQQ